MTDYVYSTAYTGVRTSPPTAGIADGDASSLRRAENDGRLWPTRGFIDDGLSDAPYLPEVVEWPYSDDLAGVAFPSGIVGVRLTPNGGLIAVPDTLPGSYTARDDMGLHRGGLGVDALVPIPDRPWLMSSGVRTPWMYGQAQYDVSPGGSSIVSALIQDPVNFGINDGPTDATLANMRWSRFTDGNAILTPNWGPMNIGRAIVQCYGRSNKWTDPHVGWRNLRLYISPTFAPGTTTTFTVTRNSDYSKGSDDLTPGGTTVLTHVVAPGDYTWTGSFYEYYANVGDLLPPDGTLGSFHINVSQSPPDIGNTYTWGWFLSPRVDIPLPWTTCGQSNLVAPGGILTGFSGNPTGSTLVALTGVDQTVSPAVGANGDGSYIYGYIDLTAGDYVFTSSGLFGGAVYSDILGQNAVGSFDFMSNDIEFTAPADGRYYVAWIATAGSTARVN